MHYLWLLLTCLVLLSTDAASQPIGTVSGTAIDIDGAPVANAMIRLSELRGHGAIEVGTTDEVGYFRVPILNGPGWVCLTASSDTTEGYHTCVLVTSSRESVVDLLVLPEGTIVEDPDGRLGFPEVPMISRSPYASVYYYPTLGDVNYGAPFTVRR